MNIYGMLNNVTEHFQNGKKGGFHGFEASSFRQNTEGSFFVFKLHFDPVSKTHLRQSGLSRLVGIRIPNIPPATDSDSLEDMSFHPFRALLVY